MSVEEVRIAAALCSAAPLRFDTSKSSRLLQTVFRALRIAILKALRRLRLE
jgi:hypothetical protein